MAASEQTLKHEIKFLRVAELALLSLMLFVPVAGVWWLWQQELLADPGIQAELPYLLLLLTDRAVFAALILAVYCFFVAVVLGLAPMTWWIQSSALPQHPSGLLVTQMVRTVWQNVGQGRQNAGGQGTRPVTTGMASGMATPQAENNDQGMTDAVAPNAAAAATSAPAMTGAVSATHAPQYRPVGSQPTRSAQNGQKLPLPRRLDSPGEDVDRMEEDETDEIGDILAVAFGHDEEIDPWLQALSASLDDVDLGETVNGLQESLVKLKTWEPVTSEGLAAYVEARQQETTQRETTRQETKEWRANNS